MSWNELKIAAAVSRQTLARKCVVLVDRCNWTGHECDVLAVTQDLRIIDVEVKISRSDLKADAKKGKWWVRKVVGYSPGERRAVYDETPREWPPKVWKHYFALPADIWHDDLLAALPSAASGVLTVREHRGRIAVECRRRAKPCRDASKLTAAQAVDIARLANLRMWDAYERLHPEQASNACTASASELSQC